MPLVFTKSIVKSNSNHNWVIIYVKSTEISKLGNSDNKKKIQKITKKKKLFEKKKSYWPRIRTRGNSDKMNNTKFKLVRTYRKIKLTLLINVNISRVRPAIIKIWI